MKGTVLHVVSGLLLCALTAPDFGDAKSERSRYGTLIGSFQGYSHNIRGTVYAVDDRTIFVKGFHYDGTGPNAYFWVGNTAQPAPEGSIIPYPEDYAGSEPPVLEAYKDKDIVLKLPQGKRIRDIKWLSVWCRRFTVNFGDVYIQPTLEVPKPRVLPEFSRLAHGLRSGNISILDSKTFYIPNLHYDGAAPDAYFWVGNGSEPNTLGTKVPNELGSLNPLEGYQGVDIEIVLPGNLTVYDIDWLGLWCVQYRQNFGHVMIPKDLDIPPALGQTKITPPWWYNPTSSTPAAAPSPQQGSQGSQQGSRKGRPELTNCKEMLDGRVQVQWELMGDDVHIRLSGRISENEYIAFGLSGTEGKAQMLGGDVVVIGYNNRTGDFIAEDYYMSDWAQCDGKKGVCPDERIGGKNDAVLIHGERKNGVTTVTYTRPLRTNEPEKDKMIPESETSVITAIGLLNARGEANVHQQRNDKTTEDVRIDFTSKNVHECTNSLYEAVDISGGIKPWKQAVITEGDTFTAKIGPTGGKRGYVSITGNPSWGIAWYINDLLIPEITVERGQTYTFIVEGGQDKSNPARYHPFYITDSPEGGYGQKNAAEQKRQRVFAGVGIDSDGYPYPTAEGRYCEWVHKTIDMSDKYDTFEEYFQTLTLQCDKGEPARLVWTVAEDTPDLVYYQCYTHNHLGWKIHVVDAGYRSERNANGADRPAGKFAILAVAAIVVSLFFR